MNYVGILPRVMTRIGRWVIKTPADSIASLGARAISRVKTRRSLYIP